MERTKIEIRTQTAQVGLRFENGHTGGGPREIEGRRQPGNSASEDSNVTALRVFFCAIHHSQSFLDPYCLEIRITPAQITAIAVHRFQETLSPRKILERIATSTYPALNKGNA